MSGLPGAVGIWLLAFALRCAVLALSWGGHGAWNIETDSGLYIGLANSLAGGQGFGTVGPDGQFYPEYLTLPPYPLLLACFKWLTSNWQFAALVTQCGLSAGVAAAVYVVSRRLTNARWAAVAGLLACCDIQAVLYSNLVLTDVLGMTATFAGLAALFRYCNRPILANAALCGLAFALAAFVRPVGAYFWLIAAVVVLFAKLGPQLRQRLAHALAIGLIAVTPVIAWSARNWLHAGSWFYSTTPDIVLVNWQLARLVMETDGVSQKEAREKIAAQLGIADTWRSLCREPDAAARQRAHALALQMVREHPRLFARLFCAGILRVAAQPDHNITLVFGQQPTETGLAKGATGFREALRARWDELSPLLRVLYFGQIPLVAGLWLLAAIGTAAGLWRPQTRPMTIALALTAACVIVTAGGYPGDPRYRLPALPVLDVLAALGLAAFAGRRCAPHQQPGS
jgi:4-amino-4-deoxy-L-arabinose transferase-like glycosyltransferase